MLITQYKKSASAETQLYFIAYSYCTCSYTTRVVWQTKCKLMMCISHVLRATVHAHASFLSFTCIILASPRKCLHA